MSGSSLVTPEGISLDVDIAGLGSRLIASLIDFAIQIGIGILLGVSLALLGSVGISEQFIQIIAIVGAFLILFGYFPVCEGIWNGRTPGKAAQRLRVIQSNGQPLSLGPMFVRNLVRLVDFLPAWYLIGSIVMVISTKSQRLGDLAAGTLVVRERKAPQPAPLLQREEMGGAVRLDTTRLSERDYGMIRSFLERRAILTREARASIAGEILQAVGHKVGGDFNAFRDKEELLEAIASSYRRRFSR